MKILLLFKDFISRQRGAKRWYRFCTSLILNWIKLSPGHLNASTFIKLWVMSLKLRATKRQCLHSSMKLDDSYAPFWKKNIYFGGYTFIHFDHLLNHFEQHLKETGNHWAISSPTTNKAELTLDHIITDCNNLIYKCFISLIYALQSWYT